MHVTLKQEATQPAGDNFLRQQEKFDTFIVDYNNERPDQAPAMNTPTEIYCPSRRPYLHIGELGYPFDDETVTVTHCGRVCY